MAPKKFIPQGSQQKVSTRSKVSKVTTIKPGKAKPSIVLGEKRTKGRKPPPACFENSLGEDIQAAIAQRAHELYEHRGRVHGYDWEDWLKAEHEILGENPRF